MMQENNFKDVFFDFISESLVDNKSAERGDWMIRLVDLAIEEDGKIKTARRIRFFLSGLKDEEHNLASTLAAEALEELV